MARNNQKLGFQPSIYKAFGLLKRMGAVEENKNKKTINLNRIYNKLKKY